MESLNLETGGGISPADARKTLARIKEKHDLAEKKKAYAELENRRGEVYDKIWDARSAGDTDVLQSLYQEKFNLSQESMKLHGDIEKAESDQRKEALAALRVENPSDTDFTSKLRDNRSERMETAINAFNDLVSRDVMNGISVSVIGCPRGRSYCSDTTIAYAKGSGEETAVHELGHVLENKGDGVREAAQKFLDSRTSGEKAILLSVATGNRDYRLNEYTKKDSFPDPYCGKIYDSGHTEVVSMGLQYMYDDAAGFAEKDPEYFDFIYNVVRGIK